jgi:hypothetical protein
MKPKEYHKKYGFSLNADEAPFEVAAMVSDLSADFLATIEYLQGCNQLNHARFNTVKEEIYQKYTSIKKQSMASKETWNVVWNQLNAQVIKAVEEKLFGDFLRKKKAEQDRRKREDSDFYNQFRSDYDFFQRAWEELLFAQLRKMAKNLVPNEAFSILGIPSSSSPEEVSKQFKKLALVNHPDKGGDHQTFVKIIDAKNRCLAFLTSNS